MCCFGGGPGLGDLGLSRFRDLPDWETRGTLTGSPRACILVSKYGCALQPDLRRRASPHELRCLSPFSKRCVWAHPAWFIIIYMPVKWTGGIPASPLPSDAGDTLTERQPTAHSPSEAKRGTESTARGSTRSPKKTYQAEELNGPAATLSSRRQVPSARRARDLRRTGSPKRRAVLGGAAALWSRGHGRCEPNERANRLGSRCESAFSRKRSSPEKHVQLFK